VITRVLDSLSTYVPKLTLKTVLTELERRQKTVMSRFRRLVKELKLPPLSLPDKIVSPLQLLVPLNKTHSRRTAVLESPASTSDTFPTIVTQPPQLASTSRCVDWTSPIAPQVDPLPRQPSMHPVATAKIESLPTREFRVTIADTTDKLPKTAKWLRLKPQKAELARASNPQSEKITRDVDRLAQRQICRPLFVQE
jgi:hypothetical protein